MSFQRLSGQDATFLYAESPVAHMHVGSIGIFERIGLSEDEFGRHIESRLHLVPRFRKRLAWVPAGLGRPVWVDDPHFDIRYHVRYTGLPEPAGIDEAKRLMGRVMSRPLDRKRPLWEMWVCDLPDNKTALIQKTHHCLIDGVSGVDVGTVMLDVGPDVPATQGPPFVPETQPTKRQLMRTALVDAVRSPTEAVTLLRDNLRKTGERPAEVRRQAEDLAKGVVAWGKATLDFAPRTSLDVKIGAHRRFDTVRASLADVKRIKNRHGCTVNDVMLATVAGGLGHFFRARGEQPAGLIMKAMVPVSVRDPSQRFTYGNKVSMMAAELPVGEADPAARIAFVRERMRGLKESKQAVGAEFWVKMSEYAPPTVLALASRSIAMQRIVNFVVTNVPGPQFPLYLRGSRMLEAYPCVPLIGTASIGIAILSYDGEVNFGLLGDWDAMPDLDALADGLRRALAEQLATA